ncbi:MAG: radical SAM protein [Planctomycetota bacterium]|jgi:predicted DNA-binding helix-hairpin-helix protein
MTAVISKPDSAEKLEILTADAQYDLACACSTSKDEHRRRGSDGKWIYPVTLPNGGKTTLFKTLISNICGNDCAYCPLRADTNVRRCSLGPEETARIFLDYYNRGKVAGLFLSSGVARSADAAMDRLNTTVRILRKKHKFRGYVHLKIIPGASNAAITEAVSLASMVSLNIETPGAAHLAKLSNRKNYIKDIIEPIKLISSLIGRGARYERVRQTTQFIVGAAGEKDAEIVKYMAGLYDRLNMQRVYFSAYQKGLGSGSLPAEKASSNPADVFTREHRLYQVDFLLRKYGFTKSDIVFGDDGDLSLSADPKLLWAQNHPEMFPVEVNRASKLALLRVPGLGPVTVSRILKRRKQAPLRSIDEIGKVGVRLQKAAAYLAF